MKFALLPVLLVLALLASGCTSSAPATPAPVVTSSVPAAPAAAAIPTLTGTWAGVAEGYLEGTGFYNASGSDALTLEVREQRGRIFAGHLVVKVNGTAQTKEIAGAIGRDGRTITLVEKGGGYSSGTITADGLDLTYMQDAPAFNIAVDTLRKI